MNKIELFLGVLIGFISTVIGTFIFIQFFTEFDFSNGIQAMRAQGYLGKIITLGSILNLAVFTIFIKLNKDLMARGIIMAVIMMTIFTLFI
ncbi:hypothetical protein [Flavobacterium faecale]|uniref:hypothetical protein n=1 Tax=Flavobacterium faecale TaxID=1355330 RepID=UPI003AAB814C